jgi:uncharacterized protein
MRFLAHEQIGPKRLKTPDGFLVLLDVPLARTGIQEYGPEEVAPEDMHGKPIDPADLYEVERLPDEVFAPEAMASANGKAFVDNHPTDDVTPQNYTQLARGHVQNISRDNDLLRGDIVVTCPDMIQELGTDRGGRREVSVGYNADYEYLGNNRLRQRNIRINHIALVDAGRCGTRCAIGDHQRRITPMAKKTIKDRLWQMLGVKDEAEFQKKLGESAEGEHDAGEGSNAAVVNHFHLNGSGPAAEETETPPGADAAPPWFKDYSTKTDKRLGDIEGVLSRFAQNSSDTRQDAEETPEQKRERETEDARRDNETEEQHKDRKRDNARKRDAARASARLTDAAFAQRLEEEAPVGQSAEARRAHDSALLSDSFQQTVSLAEIIAPGISLPTYDRAARPKATYDAICDLRRRALDIAMRDAADRTAVIDYLGGGRTLDANTSCETIRGAFLHLGGVKRQRNNDSTVRNINAQTTGGAFSRQPQINSPASINEEARKIFSI